MRRLRSLLVRVAGLFGRGRQEQDLAEELESHLQMHTDDNLRAGMTPEAARREALIQLGGLEATKETLRDRRRVPIVEAVAQDLRFAARTLRRSPGFAAVTILTLGLGIGANTAIFSIVNAVLIERLPFRDPDRIMVVWEESARRPGRPNHISPSNYIRWQERQTVFSSMSALYDWRANLTRDGAPEELVAQDVTANFFETLGVAPALGRGFAPGEGVKGNDRVAVLSFGLWQRRFGGDPGILGKSIQLNGRAFTVIGVTPRDVGLYLKKGSLVGKPAQLWTPFAFTEEMRAPRGRYMSAIARLKPGVSRQEAQTQMAGIAAGLVREFPDHDTGWSVLLVPVHEEISGEMRPTLLVLLGAVGFVLLIACANVASLLLARGISRVKEIAIRTALGAARLRVLSQLLTENLLLAVLGGAVGLLIARWGARLLVAMSPSDLSGLAQARLSAPVLAFTAAVSLLTAAICGLAPALTASRGDVQESLKESSRQGGTGLRTGRLRKAFVVTQVALAVVLLVGAGLMLRSLRSLHRIDPGFDPKGILTARVTLPSGLYEEDGKVLRFFEQAVDRVGKIPGVRAAGAISYLPFTGVGAATGFTILGEPEPPAGQGPVTDVRVCDNGYFRVMHVPLLRGRLFTDLEMRTQSDVVIIGEALARRYFPGRDPIGQKVTIDMKDDNVPTTIIGIVGDVRQADLATEARPMAYWPHPQLVMSAMTLTIRTDADPLAAAPMVERAIQSIDKDQPVSDVRTMEQWVSSSLARERFGSVLIVTFAALALLLAAIGIYGVMSYVVGQRMTEIGIRAALGAEAADLRGLILRDGARLVLLGLAIGAPLSLLLSRGLTSLLYETRGTDPVTFAVVVGLLGIVALLASYVPARRAARVAPVEALRHT